jgi:hypothetical protein
MLYVMNNKASRCTGFMPSSRMISILPRDAAAQPGYTIGSEEQLPRAFAGF